MKRTPYLLVRAAFAAVSLALGACSTTAPVGQSVQLLPGIKAALQTPAADTARLPAQAASPPTAAAQAPAPANVTTTRDDNPLPLPAGVRSERRFSVVLNNASPEVVFMALLAETPLSVAVDPAIKGPLSISLKDVTLRESLDLLRELHGLDYKVIGRHILVSPAQLQTRIFTVDYPSFNRSGRSELRVLSGSITGGASGGSGQSVNPGAAGGGSNSSAGGTAQGATSQESSRISTAQRNDLWGEIETTVKLIIGDKEGRSVVVSPQTGNIVVRALPREIRAINEYLEATRVSVQRQVMLEAKVVEVQLRDSERTGINWAAFRLGLTTKGVAGAIAPGTSLSTTGTIGDGLITVNPGVAIDAAATAAGSLLGLAFQTRNFAAVLDFLGTQGHTQVLSSPRIATMNNQKAVLKVGTDDFFVTSISSTTTAVGNTTATTPNIGVQPFFSGISLDVTPNIDANGYITLHVHPSVSSVSERTKVINLGTQGSYALPLASSEINESDAVVRAHDGNIIAIGGLMRQASVKSDSGIPGTEGSSVFRKLLGGQTSQLSEKRELVILLKPTIVDPSQEDAELRRDSLQRLLDWTETQPPPKADTNAVRGAPSALTSDAGSGNTAVDTQAAARLPTRLAVISGPAVVARVEPPKEMPPETAKLAAPRAVALDAASTPFRPALSWSQMATSVGDGAWNRPTSAPQAARPLPVEAPVPPPPPASQVPAPVKATSTATLSFVAMAHLADAATPALVRGEVRGELRAELHATRTAALATVVPVNYRMSAVSRRASADWRNTTVTAVVTPALQAPPRTQLPARSPDPASDRLPWQQSVATPPATVIDGRFRSAGIHLPAAAPPPRRHGDRAREPEPVLTRAYGRAPPGLERMLIAQALND